MVEFMVEDKRRQRVPLCSFSSVENYEYSYNSDNKYVYNIVTGNNKKSAVQQAKKPKGQAGREEGWNIIL